MNNEQTEECCSEARTLLSNESVVSAVLHHHDNLGGSHYNPESKSLDLSWTADQKENEKRKYNCKFCKKFFTMKTNCNRHEKSCNQNQESKVKFSCPNCQCSYSRQDYLKLHLKNCSLSFQNATATSSTEDLHHNASKQKTPCLIQDCNMEFYRKTTLIEHLKSAHQHQVDIRNTVIKDFSSFHEFLEWKKAEEEDTFSYFSQKNGFQVNGIHLHYYCQHDGAQKLHFNKKTSRCNSKGRVKVGHFCIAKIKLTKNDDGSCHMEYFPTHSHKTKPQDFIHHPLDESTSQFINYQIAEQVSPSKIFNKIQNVYVQRNSKDVLSIKSNIVTKKRIRERARRQHKSQQFHGDDAKSVYILTKRLIEEDNSVLLYKPYGDNVVYGPKEIDLLPNSNELFMLGIQTERQLELLKKHCGTILIIDETHGTNQYKYQLLTCMVVDENRHGWPVAHLITSKSDSATLQYFFQTLNLRVKNDAQINCVITDDDSALINSINEGFSKEFKHILCQWHVWRNLKDNVRARVEKDLRHQMLEELKVIMNEKEEQIFTKLCQGLLHKYENNPASSSFISYFKQYYLERKEKWAMCFRRFPHANVNTTGHIESFHNKLKKVYLKRKVNKRLDDLILMLRDMEWEDHCTRIRESEIGHSSTLPQHIAERHQRGIKICDDDVTEVFANTWEIKSATNRDECYVVTQYSALCYFDSCFYRCTNLQCHDLCSHLYTCSCSDRHALCKHIHKIHSMKNKDKPCAIVEDSDFYYLGSNSTEVVTAREEIATTEDMHLNQTEECANSRKRRTLLTRIGKNLDTLSNFYQNAASTSNHTLAHVDSVLNNLVLLVEEKVENKEKKLDNMIHMEPAVQYNSQEKLKSQVSQLLPFKRPLKKRKSKETPSEAAERKRRVVSNLLENLTELQEKVASPPPSH